MEQKKYMDIERLKDKYVDGFQKGDYIVVQEKIDGANFSIRYDDETDTIRSFSRKKILDLGNNLRGAWEWSQKLDKELVKEVLGTNLVLFGEWLVSHTIAYPDDRYQNAYFYDVWDTESERYLDQDKVEDIVKQLNLIYVPVFYKGTFESWDHLKQFVGRTDLGGENGEGIVVKNMTRLNDPNTRLPFYTKIVADKFAEKKSVKKFDEGKLERRAKLQAVVESVVTEGRVTKLVHKMVDEGIIPEDWDEYDMGTIAKNIGKEVYYDCVKEEPEIVEQVGELFGKLASGTAMKIVKSMLAAQTIESRFNGGVNLNKIEITNDDVLKQILLNQREILDALSKLITPICKGSRLDSNGETLCNISLVDRYHETDRLLNLYDV